MKRQSVSRRRFLPVAAATAAGLSSLSSPMRAQPPRGAPQGGPPRAPRVAQWGTGPIKALVITKDHPYDREPFFQMFDSFGKEITWTHVDHPAAQAFFDPELADAFDVFVIFDMIGRSRRAKPDGTFETVNLEPSPKLKKGMEALLKKGKGLVFFHHAIGSWVAWPEYPEILGGGSEFAALPGLPLKLRGKEYPYSPNKVGVQQHITIVDKSHPITQGLGDGFDITDEVFLHPVFEDSVHALLRTDFKRVDTNFTRQYEQGWRYPGEGSSLATWCKASERSPIVYMQFGHDAQAWENPAFRTLMMNSIRWAASKEALAWAAANSTKIFK